MVSSQKELMQKAASAIDQLVSDNQELLQKNTDLQEKLAKYERKENALDIASAMADKGMIDEEEVVKVAQKLVESDRDLSIVKEGLVAVQGVFDIGTLHKTGAEQTGDKTDPLTDFLLNT